MDPILIGRSILIVEDEPVIAIEVTAAFERAGARVLRTNTLRQALLLVEQRNLSAAVLDHGLTDGDSSKLCERLKELNIPYVLHSGYSDVDGPCRHARLVSKPADPQVLVTAVQSLLSDH
jgi:DNA-binding response OmpR family regulator